MPAYIMDNRNFDHWVIKWSVAWFMVVSCKVRKLFLHKNALKLGLRTCTCIV